MRINKFVALATGMSRRAADSAIAEGRVLVNSALPEAGQQIADRDTVTLDNKRITTPVNTVTILLNKPTGYVCSRDGQGSKTVYDLLPAELHHLKPVGRLDKDSSGLLLLTNDGELANQLTHPKYQKTKVYVVKLNKPLSSKDAQTIEKGIELEDGLSHLAIAFLPSTSSYEVRMAEGRNRQIRRTFQALGYTVVSLHRFRFGNFQLEDVRPGKYKNI